MGTLRSALVVAAALAIVGCKDGDPDSSSGSGGGGGSGSTSGTGPGSSSGTGSGGGGSSGKIGSVALLEQPTGPSSWVGVLSATFYEATGAPGCTDTTVDACVVIDCTFPDSNPTPVTQRSAGDVTVQGTAMPMTLTPNADLTYTSANVMTKLWAEGATIDISAKGADVPAFSGQLIGVSDLVLSAPSTASPQTFDRTQDVTVTWSGGAYGDASVLFARSEDDGTTTHAVVAACTWPAGDGSGVVPAAALQAIPPGPNGSFSFYDRDLNVVHVADWAISLSAISSNVATTATFQ